MTGGAEIARVDNVARRSKGGQRWSGQHGSGEAWAAIKPGGTSTLTVFRMRHCVTFA